MTTKAAISVSEMCLMLEISRSHFHWHVERGTFHAPIYLVRNKRPFFTAEMADENVRAKETGISVNGDYVIFYTKRTPSENGGATKKTASQKLQKELLRGLRSLGLNNATDQQVNAALAVCFPQGTDGHDETEVLRTVFRHIKRSEST